MSKVQTYLSTRFKKTKLNFYDMSKKNKRLKRFWIPFCNPDILNKYTIGCDPTIAGEDKTVEFYIGKDESYNWLSVWDQFIPLHLESCFKQIDEQILGESPLIRFAEATNNVKRAEEAFAKSRAQRSKAIWNTIDALKEFSNTLNELKKQKAMKITEETKIKDLIPEGYEFNPESPMEYFKSSCNVTIPVKKKEVKDFKWYVEKYFEAKYHEFADKTKVLTSYTNSYEAQKIINGEFDKVQFESKIGLLKFICDDLQVDLITMMNQLKERKYSINSISVSDICPPEFLNSIFK